MRPGLPILTARLPVARIKERWAAYQAGLDAAGHDAATKARLLAQSGSPARVRDQVAELRDAGVQHLLCQTGFGDMSHEQNLTSMRRFGEEVMPAFRP
jgi:alkanesulfonate monooxygenase SsuD/methylene tetrahydromethanopterin reductase-like flavin-dependent oxidoreductase (luciferase family)